MVAILYAGDRENAKHIINKWLSQDILVIVDRYVYSNIAFQCAKINNLSEKESLKRWILDLEYNYNNIPSPEVSVFLQVPFEFITNKLKEKRSGSDRIYLNGKKDIHESSFDLQKEVELEYMRLVEQHNDFYIVECEAIDKKMLSSEKIHRKIVDILTSKNII